MRKMFLVRDLLYHITDKRIRGQGGVKKKTATMLAAWDVMEKRGYGKKVISPTSRKCLQFQIFNWKETFDAAQQLEHNKWVLFHKLCRHKSHNRQNVTTMVRRNISHLCQS